MASFERYFRAVRCLESLAERAEKKYGENRRNPEIYLKRMSSFLDMIGNPEKGMKYIHIGGTAGKGSVCSMAHSMLVASGENAGLFTKPFATTSIEKIKVNNLLISPAEFAGLADYLKPSIEEAYKESPYGGPSYFEAFFALALEYFKRKGCSWAVIEVGLGGSYDATNVIPPPAAAAITNIGYDHTHVLGDTLEKIARDKAGIIKSGSVFFTAERRPELLAIFRERCEKAGVPFNAVKAAGDYKKRNEELAKAVGMAIGIKKDFVEKGAENAALPCRFEAVQNNPSVILDGAHNPMKMESVAYNLGSLEYRKLNLVIAVSGDKDIEGILKTIAPLADRIFATEFEAAGRKSAEAGSLARMAEKHVKRKAQVHAFKNPHEALEAAMEEAGKEDAVLITGSFFLAGELRKRWYPEELILETRDAFCKKQVL